MTSAKLTHTSIMREFFGHRVRLVGPLWGKYGGTEGEVIGTLQRGDEPTMLTLDVGWGIMHVPVTTVIRLEGA